MGSGSSLASMPRPPELWGEVTDLLDRAADVVFRYRVQPRVGFEYVSGAVRRVSGYTPAELYADPGLLLGLVHRDDRAVLCELLERGATQLPTVLRWVRKDGTVIWIELRAISIRAADGSVVALEAIAREVEDPTFGVGPAVRILGDLRIDLYRSRVVVAGVPVRLTPAEFRVLAILTDNPGRVVARSTIVEALWDSSHDGNGRAIEVHISALRRKIERDPADPRRIETARGRGYRFMVT